VSANTKHLCRAFALSPKDGIVARIHQICSCSVLKKYMCVYLYACACVCVCACVYLYACYMRICVCSCSVLRKYMRVYFYACVKIIA